MDRSDPQLCTMALSLRDARCCGTNSSRAAAHRNALIDFHHLTLGLTEALILEVLSTDNRKIVFSRESFVLGLYFFSLHVKCPRSQSLLILTYLI